jgi:hypothetical protein
MKERKEMRIQLLTNSGYRYTGEKISEDSSFIEIKDDKMGIIKIPLVNISFMKELGG